ncbi:hypothetical protein KZ813_16820 [Sphingomonas sp. RHCKR7]|uniref:hypothetical protein n=1 Tax=Sphingomonas folli TaxID=2862497 RepID=UPI001CA4A386|nr:hypothetical protein [Sphingomonas folli]MBW6528508.1 hypothetical protein [Sphingomonas folli]
MVASFFFDVDPASSLVRITIRDMQIQLQASASLFRQRLLDRRVAERLITFVVSRSLARGQIIRAVEIVNAEFLTDVGRRWRGYLPDMGSAEGRGDGRWSRGVNAAEMAVTLL